MRPRRTSLVNSATTDFSTHISAPNLVRSVVGQPAAANSAAVPKVADQFAELSMMTRMLGWLPESGLPVKMSMSSARAAPSASMQAAAAASRRESLPAKVERKGWNLMGFLLESAAGSQRLGGRGPQGHALAD